MLDFWKDADSMGAIIITIRNNVEIEYTFWLYGSVHAIFGQFK
jgi:hypothetical protein